MVKPPNTIDNVVLVLLLLLITVFFQSYEELQRMVLNKRLELKHHTDKIKFHNVNKRKVLCYHKHTSI